PLDKHLYKAKVRRTIDGRLSEEVESEFFAYDSRTEIFTLRNTNTGEDRPGAGRNTIILQSKRTPPAKPVASTGAP
ncbi:MAG: lipopolysaccharide transport periplasmic protein LptA, partial [Telluria sp.]